uniref:Microtubule-associated protein 1B/S N-terminal domain-containing protein n=1 Tax=Poecilia latipinna TaxID=48699 RepID=A0A3B3VBK1_9TELE
MFTVKNSELESPNVVQFGSECLLAVWFHYYYYFHICPPVLRLTLKALFFSFPAGIRSWDVNLKSCDLDQQLQLFITRHSAHFSSKVRGHRWTE